MIFKRDYGTLVTSALSYLTTSTDITNVNAGGITRSLIEILNLSVSEYYDILDVNTAMGFVSSAEGYFLDLIGDLFNLSRLTPNSASASVGDQTQKFYVVTGTLLDRLPGGAIAQNTIVSSSDGTINFKVSSNTPFDAGATEVYVPITASTAGSNSNVGLNVLTSHNLGINDVFTTNVKVIVGGSNLESDNNFRYRIVNSSLSAEKANETAIRLAVLSVPGVANVIFKPFARGIGTFDAIVLPVEGLPTSKLISDAQAAIDSVQAFGLTGTARAPDIVPVDIEVRLVFVNNTTSAEKLDITNRVRTAISQYIVNIPIGESFILNELRQQIMDVSQKIKDHTITCYEFREQPVFIGNVDIYWDEMFYPNTNSAEAIRVL